MLDLLLLHLSTWDFSGHLNPLQLAAGSGPVLLE